MGSCNTTQKEQGGKHLLLKACVEGSVASTSASTTFTSVAHGLRVGDIAKPKTVGANTTVDVDGYYYVKSVPTDDTFTVSATRGGAAISADATEAAMEWDLFRAVGGIRSKSFSFSAEGVDITNEDSDEWTTLLDGAGMRSLEVSGSGVYNNNDVLESIEEKFLANELSCLMLISVKTGRIYEGCFKLTSLEISGDHDAESNFSISASSSGEVNTATIAA